MSHLRRATLRRRPPDSRPAEFDMTPMIDVTFQLIVFFLVANDLSRKEIVDLDLPMAAHAADDSDPQGGRVIVNVRKRSGGADAPPVVTIRGREFDPRQLARELQTRADLHRPRGSGTPSELTTLVRADRDAPWSDVQHVMQACGAPRVGIYRLQFAATLDPSARRAPPRSEGGAR